jgi:TusA-related sulfurtransferase
MSNRGENKEEAGPALFLDITEDVCPFTFVRTKLLLEGMQPGEVAEIRLRGAEPLSNVPRAVRAGGHEVLSLVSEQPADDADGPHRLRIRRT